MREKKGVSAVVATVLLILITLMAIGILWIFIKPMVEKNLEEGASCFELRDQAEIVQGDYTYYNNTVTSLVIKRGFKGGEIKGYRVSINFGADSEAFDLINNTVVSGNIEVTMSDGATTIALPDSGEAKNYIFKKANGTQADLGIITKSGNICKMGSYDIPEQE